MLRRTFSIWQTFHFSRFQTQKTNSRERERQSDDFCFDVLFRPDVVLLSVFLPSAMRCFGYKCEFLLRLWLLMLFANKSTTESPGQHKGRRWRSTPTSIRWGADPGSDAPYRGGKEVLGTRWIRCCLVSLLSWWGVFSLSSRTLLNHIAWASSS